MYLSPQAVVDAGKLDGDVAPANHHNAVFGELVQDEGFIGGDGMLCTRNGNFDGVATCRDEDVFRVQTADGAVGGADFNGVRVQYNPPSLCGNLRGIDSAHSEGHRLRHIGG